MTHDSRPSDPINRPASNARRASASELGRATALPQGSGEDFLGLNADLAAHSTPTVAAPAVPAAVAPSSVREPLTGPGDSWLFDRAEEQAAVPVETPSAPAALPEPSPILNTSWSEDARRSRKSRWIAPVLAISTVAAVALVGYPALDRATDGPPASEVRLQRSAAVDVAIPRVDGGVVAAPAETLAVLARGADAVQAFARS